jgi:hypothetical protein
VARVILLFVLPTALAIYAVVDCLQSEEEQVGGLPKIIWVLIILMFPFAGPGVWLLMSRGAQPRRHRSRRPGHHGPPVPPPGPAGRAVPPDDDPEFLAGLRGPSDEEHERMLRQWEESLRRRERNLRGEDTDDDPPEGDDP